MDEDTGSVIVCVVREGEISEDLTIEVTTLELTEENHAIGNLLQKLPK